MSARLTHLLDTNIVIALIKGDAMAHRHMRQHHAHAIGLPVMVMQELYFGAYKSHPAKMAGNLQNIAHLRLDVLDFDVSDAEQAGQLRATLAQQGTPIGPYDALIAAQAHTRDLTLVTHNTREFARVPGLRVEDWLS